MLLKESWIQISDNTNVRWVKIFHLYKGFNRKKTYTGLFIKGSSRVVEPPRLEYKGFKYKYLVKGDITRSWVVRSVYSNSYIDTSSVSFSNNTSILISKKQNIKSKFVNGPLPLTIRTKKLNSVFSFIL
jgi:ribosomal protein L14